MKFLVLLGDGMADSPVPHLKGQTPLEAAVTPHMDRLARDGICGLVHTVPEGLGPGSDVCNLVILGYDARAVYTGRAPLEAASLGIPLAPDDLAFRCNLVTVEIQEGKALLVDYSAGHISTAVAADLIKAVQARLGTDTFRFYPGKSYRHLFVWRGGPDDIVTVGPHDIPGQEISRHLPQGPESAVLVHFMSESMGLLGHHPVNRARARRGEAVANMIWLWGQGRAPRLPTLRERYGLTGAMISAVDLLRGLGVYAGMDVIEVEGATGWIDTNYAGKVKAACEALATHDLVFLHVEAPDEAGHQGDWETKVRALEDFDAKVVGPMLAEGDRRGDVRVLLLPDHATPVAFKSHVDDPVPFAIFPAVPTPDGAGRGAARYSEAAGRATGLTVREGERLFTLFLGRAA